MLIAKKAAKGVVSLTCKKTFSFSSSGRSSSIFVAGPSRGTSTFVVAWMAAIALGRDQCRHKKRIYSTNMKDLRLISRPVRCNVGKCAPCFHHFPTLRHGLVFVTLLPCLLCLCLRVFQCPACSIFRMISM